MSLESPVGAAWSRFVARAATKLRHHFANLTAQLRRRIGRGTDPELRVFKFQHDLIGEFADPAYRDRKLVRRLTITPHGGDRPGLAVQFAVISDRAALDSEFGCATDQKHLV